MRSWCGEQRVDAVWSNKFLARCSGAILPGPRLGQGGFRVLVTDTYRRRCAVTGERTLPVLQAAHIRPVTAGGLHSNTMVPAGNRARNDLAAALSVAPHAGGDTSATKRSKRSRSPALTASIQVQCTSRIARSSGSTGALRRRTTSSAAAGHR